MQSSKKKSPSMLVAIGGALVVIIAVAVMLMGVGRENPSPEAQFAYRYMKSDLDGLIMAQTMTRRLTGSYSSDAERAGQMQSLGVNKPLVTLSGEGWFAVVTSTKVPEIKCAVAVDARNPLKRSAESGEIVCR